MRSKVWYFNMTKFVSFHALFSIKCLATNITYIWFLSSMYFQMPVKMAAGLKTSGTSFTCEKTSSSIVSGHFWTIWNMKDTSPVSIYKLATISRSAKQHLIGGLLVSWQWPKIECWLSYVLNRGSYMSAHLLLNLLNELKKEIKCEACWAFYPFFATSLINSVILYKSMNVRFYLSYDIKITLKSHFCSKNIIFLSLCTQRCHGRHNISC